MEYSQKGGTSWGVRRPLARQGAEMRSDGLNFGKRLKSAVCIPVQIRRDPTRGSIIHRRERGRAATPPSTAGRRRRDMEPLGVSVCVCVYVCV